MRRMDCAAQILASEPDAAMFRARVPSGSASHLSGKRFAAPVERAVLVGIGFELGNWPEKAHNAPRLVVFILVSATASSGVRNSSLLGFLNGPGDISL